MTQTRPVIWGLSLSSDQTPLMALVFVTFHSSDRFIPRRPALAQTHGQSRGCCFVLQSSLNCVCFRHLLQIRAAMAGSQPGPMFIKEEIKDQDEAESFETRYDALEMLSESHFVTSLVCARHVSCTADTRTIY